MAANPVLGPMERPEARRDSISDLELDAGVRQLIAAVVQLDFGAAAAGGGDPAAAEPCRWGPAGGGAEPPARVARLLAGPPTPAARRLLGMRDREVVFQKDSVLPLGRTLRVVRAHTDSVGLETMRTCPPEDCDPATKERYLSDADFFEAFGQTKASFSALPQWKQIEMKRAASLF